MDFCRMKKSVTPAQSVEHIESGHRIFVHTATATPNVLINALKERHSDLRGVKIHHLHTEGNAPYTHPD